VSLAEVDPHRARLVELVDQLAGDVVLRHVAGRQVLDLGHGSPRVADWVRRRAARLRVVEAEALEDTAAFDPATFEVVFSLRTLPHVGTDEDSSLAAARALLRETARVLQAGGRALVQIDNPASLVGLYHGVRNPMTVVGFKSLVAERGKGVTRFDTIARLRELLPPELELRGLHGLRVLVPLPHLLGVPVLGHLLARGEWLARDSPILRRFGAHLLVVLHRLSSEPRAE
jgi:SAM-dependent methyltransferase